MKQHKAIGIVTLCFLFLIMLFPVWGNLLPQGGETSLNEKRDLTPWPAAGSLNTRIKLISNFIDDRLAFREPIIAGVLRMDLALGESPHNQVMIGQDGWLYYDEGGYSKSDILRIDRLDQETLGQIAEAQQATEDIFTAAQTDYRILVAPDKHTIYPDYLPLNCRQGEGPSALDEIYQTLGEKTTVKWVDVRPALQAKAGETDLYYRTDTHWNSSGAWVAYQALMDALLPEHPEMRKLTEEDVTRSEATFSGDLAIMIGMENEWIGVFTQVSVKKSAAREDPESGLTTWFNDELPEGPHMLLLYDSFGPELIPFLRESVGALTLVSNEQFYRSVIGDPEQYDIVIMEVVERNATWLGSGLEAGSEEDEEEEEESEYLPEFDDEDEPEPEEEEETEDA